MKVLIGAILILSLAVFMTFEILQSVEIDCEVCMEFQGRRGCARAHGETKELAIEEGHRSACAQLTSGVTETLACQRQEPSSAKCF